MRLLQVLGFLLLLSILCIPALCEEKTLRIYNESDFINFMKSKDVLTVFHYVPLHTAPAGLKYGRFHGEDNFTTRESDRLVRLPMYYALTEDDVNFICECVHEYFEG